VRKKMSSSNLLGMKFNVSGLDITQSTPWATPSTYIYIYMF